METVQEMKELPTCKNRFIRPKEDRVFCDRANAWIEQSNCFTCNVERRSNRMPYEW